MLTIEGRYQGTVVTSRSFLILFVTHPKFVAQCRVMAMKVRINQALIDVPRIRDHFSRAQDGLDLGFPSYRDYNLDRVGA